MDATFVDAPRQRNSRDENKQIKNGEFPEEWEENPHKKAQKDVDARWTKKGNETHYGYKDHFKMDADSKIITDYATTSTNVHNSNEFTDFLNETDRVIYADSAYVGKEIPEHIENSVCEKGYRGRPFSDEQKSAQPGKIKDSLPNRVCIRLYDRIHARIDGSLRRNQAGGLQHWAYPSCLHPLQVRHFETKRGMRGITRSNWACYPVFQS